MSSLLDGSAQRRAVALRGEGASGKAQRGARTARGEADLFSAASLPDFSTQQRGEPDRAVLKAGSLAALASCRGARGRGVLASGRAG